VRHAFSSAEQAEESVARGARVGVVLSGGNIDPALLIEILQAM